MVTLSDDNPVTFRTIDDYPPGHPLEGRRQVVLALVTTTADAARIRGRLALAMERGEADGTQVEEWVGDRLAELIEEHTGSPDTVLVLKPGERGSHVLSEGETGIPLAMGEDGKLRKVH